MISILKAYQYLLWQLEGVFKKTIYDLPNPRLQRMREKLSGYNFDVKWVPGKTHWIADALLRAPLFSAQEEEGIDIDII